MRQPWHDANDCIDANDPIQAAACGGSPMKPVLSIVCAVLLIFFGLLTPLAQAETAARSAAAGSGVAMRLALDLKAPIEQGLLEVEAVDRYIVIRIPEQPAFTPESATLRPAYLPVLASVRVALKSLQAAFTVAGHTDDVVISTAKYRSNWELAAGRASAVIVELLKTAELAPERFTLVSYGATRPLISNTSAENRARNRRVEIVIQL